MCEKCVKINDEKNWFIMRRKKISVQINLETQSLEKFYSKKRSLIFPLGCEPRQQKN